TGVFFHLGQGMDYFVPAEVPARNLQNRIFEKSGPQEPGRATALARAHPHGHSKLFIEICHSHLKPFPHVRGKSAERHAADNKGIYLPHGGYPAVLAVELQVFLRRKNTAKQGPQLEFMTARIECRVCEHRDSDELY